MIFPLCSEKYLIEISMPLQMINGNVIPVRCRQTKAVIGDINFSISLDVLEVRINPNCDELSLVLTQFLFLDPYINKIIINNISLMRPQYLLNWMPDLPITHVSCAIMLDDSGNVLLGQRDIGGFYGGVWEMPGGKLDKCEASDQALVRELEEELNILVKTADLFYLKTYNYVYPGKRIMLHVFKCYKWQGKINNMVHDNLKWVQYNKIIYENLPPANLSLLIEFPELGFIQNKN